MTIGELVRHMFSLRALDVLIDEKYRIQEEYNNGEMSYTDYEHCSSVIQDRIDYISPIDISFI
jgi:hypothetical protein